MDESFQWYCKEQPVKKLLKILWKTSIVESNFEWNFGTACMKFYEHTVAYCILYYIVLYTLIGVKPLFNGKHLIKNKIYVAVYT